MLKKTSAVGGLAIAAAASILLSGSPAEAQSNLVQWGHRHHRHHRHHIRAIRAINNRSHISIGIRNRNINIARIGRHRFFRHRFFGNRFFDGCGFGCAGFFDGGFIRHHRFRHFDDDGDVILNGVDDDDAARILRHRRGDGDVIVNSRRLFDD